MATMASIYLAEDLDTTTTAFKIANNDTMVSGGAVEDDKISILSGVTGTTVASTIESVTLSGALSDYKFKQGFGSNIEVYDSTDTLVMSMGDIDEKSITFSDGALDLVYNDETNTCTIGGETISNSVTALSEYIGLDKTIVDDGLIIYTKVENDTTTQYYVDDSNGSEVLVKYSVMQRTEALSYTNSEDEVISYNLEDTTIYSPTDSEIGSLSKMEHLKDDASIDFITHDDEVQVFDADGVKTGYEKYIATIEADGTVVSSTTEHLNADHTMVTATMTKGSLTKEHDDMWSVTSMSVDTTNLTGEAGAGDNEGLTIYIENINSYTSSTNNITVTPYTYYIDESGDIPSLVKFSQLTQTTETIDSVIHTKDITTTTNNKGLIIQTYTKDVSTNEQGEKQGTVITDITKTYNDINGIDGSVTTTINLDGNDIETSYTSIVKNGAGEIQNSTTRDGAKYTVKDTDGNITDTYYDFTGLTGVDGTDKDVGLTLYAITNQYGVVKVYFANSNDELVKYTTTTISPEGTYKRSTDDATITYIQTETIINDASGSEIGRLRETEHKSADDVLYFTKIDNEVQVFDADGVKTGYEKYIATIEADGTVVSSTTEHLNADHTMVTATMTKGSKTTEYNDMWSVTSMNVDTANLTGEAGTGEYDGLTIYTEQVSNGDWLWNTATYYVDETGNTPSLVKYSSMSLTEDDNGNIVKNIAITNNTNTDILYIKTDNDDNPFNYEGKIDTVEDKFTTIESSSANITITNVSSISKFNGLDAKTTGIITVEIAATDEIDIFNINGENILTIGNNWDKSFTNTTDELNFTAFEGAAGTMAKSAVNHTDANAITLDTDNTTVYVIDSDASNLDDDGTADTITSFVSMDAVATFLNAGFTTNNEADETHFFVINDGSETTNSYIYKFTDSATNTDIDGSELKLIGKITTDASATTVDDITIA